MLIFAVLIPIFAAFCPYLKRLSNCVVCLFQDWLRQPLVSKIFLPYILRTMIESCNYIYLSVYAIGILSIILIEFAIVLVEFIFDNTDVGVKM